MNCRLGVTASGTPTAADLVQRLRVSPASISQTVALLEQHGLLKRERPPRRAPRTLCRRRRALGPVHPRGSADERHPARHIAARGRDPRGHDPGRRPLRRRCRVPAPRERDPRAGQQSQADRNTGHQS
ncbi:helix-turn-helix domain-containing protein [Nonomuraea sp. NPDC048901]|uniref:helix-turn-helix domain-containing protein n=1 Tax=Nonomuraea sp. NPDC048901 TaxID=3155627 RepID=UPI0033D9AB97